MAAAEAALNSLTNRIYGTPAQRRAGEILFYHDRQDPLRACMAQARFTYTPPPFVDIYANATSFPIPDGVGEWTALIDKSKIGIGIGNSTINSSGLDADRPNPSYDKLSPKDKASYNAALDNCLKSARDPGDDNFPSAKASLDDQLVKLVASVEHQPEIVTSASGYASCMRAAGIPVKNYHDLIDTVQRHFATAEPPLAHQAASQAWLNAVSYEGNAAMADATCRQPTHNAVMLLLLPQLGPFVATHAAELTLVDQQWSDIIAKAATYTK